MKMKQCSYSLFYSRKSWGSMKEIYVYCLLYKGAQLVETSLVQLSITITLSQFQEIYSEVRPRAGCFEFRIEDCWYWSGRVFVLLPVNALYQQLYSWRLRPSSSTYWVSLCTWGTYISIILTRQSLRNRPQNMIEKSFLKYHGNKRIQIFSILSQIISNLLGSSCKS